MRNLGSMFLSSIGEKGDNWFYLDNIGSIIAAAIVLNVKQECDRDEVEKIDKELFSNYVTLEAYDEAIEEGDRKWEILNGRSKTQKDINELESKRRSILDGGEQNGIHKAAKKLLTVYKWLTKK